MAEFHCQSQMSHPPNQQNRTALTSASTMSARRQHSSSRAAAHDAAAAGWHPDADSDHDTDYGSAAARAARAAAAPGSEQRGPSHLHSGLRVTTNFAAEVAACADAEHGAASAAAAPAAAAEPPPRLHSQCATEAAGERDAPQPHAAALAKDATAAGASTPRRASDELNDAPVVSPPHERLRSTLSNAREAAKRAQERATSAMDMLGPGRAGNNDLSTMLESIWNYASDAQEFVITAFHFVRQCQREQETVGLEGTLEEMKSAGQSRRQRAAESQLATEETGTAAMQERYEAALASAALAAGPDRRPQRGVKYWQQQAKKAKGEAKVAEREAKTVHASHTVACGGSTNALTYRCTCLAASRTACPARACE